MTKLGKIEIKRMFGTSDGNKFDTLEEAQIYAKRLEFRRLIGIN